MAILLEAVDAVNNQRLERGDNAENTPEEDALSQSLVSALGNILLGNPQLTQRAAVIEKLSEIVRVPDTQQDLRVNFQAINMLGMIGDASVIPLFAEALFMQGRRRPVALQEIVRPNMMLIDDLEAMADAMVKVGQMQNTAVNEMQKAAPGDEFDIRIIKEQAAITLGLIGITNKAVIDYLESELNHVEVDDLDKVPSRGKVSFQPEEWAGRRRAWAAEALAKLHHDPALPILVERMQVPIKNNNVDYAWEHLQEVEIPPLLDALGDFILPEKTNETILPFALYADEGRLDRAGRRLGLQAGPEIATKLEQRANGEFRGPIKNLNAFEECDEETRQRGCLRDHYLQDYIPAMRAGEGCTTIDCWAGHLSSNQAFMRERAAYQIAMLAYGDEAASNAARPALIKQLVNESSQEITPTLIFAIDRVSPNGCDEACRDQIQKRIDHLGRRGSQKAARRFIIGLLGRLEYRSKQGG